MRLGLLVIAAILASLTCTALGAAGTEEPLVWKVMTRECYDVLLVEQRVDVDCAKAIISKLLGYTIMFGSAILKLPIIINVLRSGSVAGIAPMSLLLESAQYVITMSFNIIQGQPLSSYGENIVIFVQNVIILGLILVLGRRMSVVNKFLGILVFVALVAAAWGPFLREVYATAQETGAVEALQQSPGMLSEFLQRETQPEPVVQYLQLVYMGNIALFSVSRLPQIWLFAKEGTGSFSGITLLLQFGGSAARVLTTLQEVNDPTGVILVGFIVATLLNGILFTQYVYFWLVGPKKVKPE